MEDETRERGMAKDNFEEELLKHFADTPAPRTIHRSGSCPDENALAAFAENSLEDSAAQSVRDHLSTCAHCMQQVTFLFKTGGIAELPEVPQDLLRKAVKLPRGGWTGRRLFRQGIPALAAAAAILLVVFLLIPSTDLGPGSQSFEEVRGTVMVGFSVLSPSAESEVKGLPLDIRWQPVAGSDSYQVRITSLTGELIWQQNTGREVTSLRSEPNLEPGDYYLYVRALLPEGRVIRSAPVRFRFTSQATEQ